MKRYLTPDDCPGFTGRVVNLGKKFATLEIEGTKYLINRIYLDWIYRDMTQGYRQLYLPVGAYIDANRRAWNFASKGTCFSYSIACCKYNAEEDISI